MTTKLRFTIALITALGLVSCASTRGFPERVISADDELADLRTYFKTEEITRYNKVITDDEKKRVRNEIINGRLTAIDIQFSLFQQELHEQGIGLNIGSDAITLGLGAAGALASGGASQILSAASAAVTGLRGSIDKNAFFEQTMPALFAQMIAQRKKVLVKIRNGLAGDTTNYPLQQGFADLGDYQYAGSVPGSIATIVEDAGVTSAAATTDMKDIVIRSSLDETAREIIKSSGVIKDEHFENEQKIKDCMLSAGVPKGTKFTIVMHNKEFATLRPKVLECMRQP